MKIGTFVMIEYFMNMHKLSKYIIHALNLKLIFLKRIPTK